MSTPTRDPTSRSGSRRRALRRRAPRNGPRARPSAARRRCGAAVRARADPGASAWSSSSRSSCSSCSWPGPVVDLWTDAIWYKSVGFDARLLDAHSARRSGLFALGARGRAGRSCSSTCGWPAAWRPPPDPEQARPAPGRSADRAAREAQRQAERNARMRGEAPVAARGGPFGPARPRTGDARQRRLRPGRHARTSCPIAQVGHRGDRPRCSPRRRPAPSPAPGTRVLLWVNRVPFSPDGHGHRPDLRQGHQLLPVRAAVPAPRSSR